MNIPEISIDALSTKRVEKTATTFQGRCFATRAYLQKDPRTGKHW